MTASTITAPVELGVPGQAPPQKDVREAAGSRASKTGANRPPGSAPASVRQEPIRGRTVGRPLTDDEILGIGTPVRTAVDAESSGDATRNPDEPEPDAAAGVDEGVRAALDAHPELRRVWDEAQSYRDAFATPEAARAATAQLADLSRLDALFYSRRPEDHAELARVVAGLDPAAFSSLAQAMAALAAAPHIPANVSRGEQREGANRSEISRPESVRSQEAAAGEATAAQTEFFHSANDAAVRGVLEAIETQVERLLPEGVSKTARNRVVGEIYRELDTTLRSNRQLGDQMRQAFRSGALDDAHQRAIVSLVTGRARQALPGVARRVLSEWTSTLVAASQDRRTRQRAAERRVDIAGASGGNDGRRSMTPRDLDYKRLSDADILNL